MRESKEGGGWMWMRVNLTTGRAAFPLCRHLSLAFLNFAPV